MTKHFSLIVDFFWFSVQLCTDFGNFNRLFVIAGESAFTE